MGNIAILISGTGSNMQAFIDACESGELAARISIVISNNPDAAGLQRAANAGIKTKCINHRDYDSREVFDAALCSALQEHDIDLVILAGFMRILTPVFIEPYLGQLLNIHPSLLPKYPGLHTHQRALDAGDKEGGVTVHFVTPELDSGPAIIQARVPIQAGDTAESLAARVLVEEHKIYPLAAQWFLQRRLQLTNSGATLDGEAVPETGVPYQ
ncbi:MAG: phosphoribosylglycinamide formyltransferase [Proteobacteria bacterium]|nr:phosphoribosylglycinamide formyltransferase [Pseudomonadota bacterium]